MTDERRPSDDVLDAIHKGLLEDLTIDLDPDLNRSGLRFAAIDALNALSAAGFVVLRVPEGTAQHGDELTAIDIGHAYATLGAINGNDYVKYVYGDYVHESYDVPFKPSGHEIPLFAAVRRPVPEPATKPCPVKGHHLSRGTQNACPVCGGSGVATTEGDKQ